MLCRRFFLILFSLMTSFGAFANLEGATAEKMIYVSLEVENGGELDRSRIMKELLLQLSLVKKAHFIMLSEGQGKSLDDGFKELYYLKLQIVLKERAELVFTLFDEKNKKVVKKVSKDGIDRQKLFTLAKAGMRLVIGPLIEGKSPIRN